MDGRYTGAGLNCYCGSCGHRSGVCQLKVSLGRGDSMNKKVFSVIAVFMLSLSLCFGSGWAGGFRISGATPATINYFESATMTDGSQITVDAFFGAGYEGWRAFDSAPASFWSILTAQPHWIMYDMGVNNSNVVDTISLRANQANIGFNLMIVQGSQDSNTWTTIYSNSVANVLAQSVSTGNRSYYRYYKLIGLTTHWPNYCQYTTINLSAADYQSPVMLASNSPAPYNVSASAYFSETYAPWTAFSAGNDNVYGWITTAPLPQWIKVDMGSNVVFNGGFIVNQLNYGIENYTLDGSLDDSSYSTIQTGTFANVQSKQVFTNSNTTAYRYYRLTATSGHGAQIDLPELKYGHYKYQSGVTPANFKYPQWDNPLMTSATTPNGTASADTESYGASYAGWYAFDKADATLSRWASASAFPHWLQWDAGAGNSNVAVTLLIANIYYPEYTINAFLFQGSNDGSSWTNLISSNLVQTTTIAAYFQSFQVSNPAYYRYYRLYGTSGFTPPYANLEFAKFSSAKLISPTMTDSNSPSPYVVSASSAYTDTYYGVTCYGWKAFDNKSWNLDAGVGQRSQWVTANQSYPAWVKIDMGSNVLVNGFGYVCVGGQGFNDMQIAASLDDVTYTSLIQTNLNDTAASGNSTDYQHILTQNKTSYRYYKFTTTNAYNTAGYNVIAATEILLWQYELQ